MKHTYLIILIYCSLTASAISNNSIAKSVTNGYAVGTIAGQANVTPTGCATYTIPLDLPKGCGELTPELSITYNSMSNIGNMGWGFSLEGLSSITRVPCDLFHDNQVTAVNFSDTDNYALDGIRLLRNSSNDTVFYPEINNFARVVSVSPTNPQKFTVYSPDGTITQYGYTSDSQVQGTNEDTGKVLTWKANRVSDSNGNYYTITYSETSDRFPTKINYSANSKGGIEPTLSVEFSFSRSSFATDAAYINSTAIKTGSYLYEIKINKGTKCLRKYDLTYNNSIYPILQSIKLTGSDGITSYNPTTFTWNTSTETTYDSQTDAANRPTMYTLGGDKTIKRAYDINTGRPTRINNASQIIHTYSYDCLGNMLSHSDSINNQSETFRYDNLYRLIKVRQANNSYDEYQYDGAGNLLFKSSLGTLNYLDESNKIDFINADSTHLKQWPTIEYSSFNKVTKIKNSLSSYSIRYGLDQEPESTTDMFAAIITKKIFGKYYDSSNTYSDGEFIKSNICHMFAGDKEICTVENGNINGDLYKYYDAMGSVIGTIKQSTGKLTEYSYDAWGRARDAKNWTRYTMHYPDGAGYCGHEYISNYQIINMSGRMYDPIVGRFISPDPHVQDPSNSQNLNRYVYCLNNPLKYTDPTGEFFIIDDFLIGMVKGLVKGGWKRGWKEAAKLSSNSAKIWAGLIATGAGRNFWTASLELLSRFTYQSIQTTIGFTLMHGYNSIGGAINETGYVRTRYGAVVLPTRALGIGKAFTSGNYITANIKTKADPNNPTFQHEYGHYLQSLQLGPAYTSFISIPSLLNAAIGDNHKTQPYEMDANRRSFKFFHNKYPALAWYFFSNPLYCKQIKRSKESDNISQQDFNNNPYSMGYNEIYNW